MVVGEVRGARDVVASRSVAIGGFEGGEDIFDGGSCGSQHLTKRNRKWLPRPLVLPKAVAL